MPPSSSSHLLWIWALFLATAYSATPLVLAAMGGILSERAGVVNIALEGLILAGAFTGVMAGQHSAALGLGFVVLVGALLGFVHAVLTQRFRVDHVVSGLAITLFASGATRALFQRYLSSGVQIDGLPQWFFLAITMAAPIAVTLTLRYTRFGLRLRAVGESPESARMAGIAPEPPRYAAVTLSGVFGALAGAFLSMSVAHRFAPDMSAGKGFIALAAVIFGKWNPSGVVIGCLLFGFCDAAQSAMQISQIHLHLLGIDFTNPFLLQTVPYVATLIALVTVVGRAAPPAALGKSE